MTTNKSTTSEVNQAILNLCYQQSALIEALALIARRTASQTDAKTIDRAIRDLSRAWETAEDALGLIAIV